MRRAMISTTILASLVSSTVLAGPIVEQDQAALPGWLLLIPRDAQTPRIPPWILLKGAESDDLGRNFQDDRILYGVRYEMGRGEDRWGRMPTTLDDGWMMSLYRRPVGQGPVGDGSDPGPVGQGPAGPGFMGQPPILPGSFPVGPMTSPVSLDTTPTTRVEVPEPGTLTLLGLGLLGLGFARRGAGR